MSFFKRLGDLFSGGGSSGGDTRVYRVSCNKCSEIIETRVHMGNDLSQDYDTGHYTVRKMLVGNAENRCFQRIELFLTFDKNKQLIDQQVTGGELLYSPENESQN